MPGPQCSINPRGNHRIHRNVGELLCGTEAVNVCMPAGVSKHVNVSRLSSVSSLAMSSP